MGKLTFEAVCVIGRRDEARPTRAAWSLWPVVALGMCGGPVAAQVARPAPTGTPTTLRWGPQRPDLVRFNRVEALSLGARGQLRLSGPRNPVSATATARLGLADLHPNGRLELSRETIRSRITVNAFHELAAIDEDARPFGVPNSVLGATVGRDDGDYFRRTGGALVWTPPSAGRRSYRVSGFAEHHTRVGVETGFALLRLGDEEWVYRPNIVADEGWEYGAAGRWMPRWGTDPDRPRASVDLDVRLASGARDYARAGVTGHLEVPLVPRLHLALTAGAGSTWGTPSAQRLWYMGGARSLRGYAPRALGGQSFGRARGHVARAFPFGRLGVFSDVAWAGRRDAVDAGAGLWSVGGSASLLDDLIHVDAAWGLIRMRDFRLDVYLDQGL